jgi:hypothetical protein
MLAGGIAFAEDVMRGICSLCKTVEGVGLSHLVASDGSKEAPEVAAAHPGNMWTWVKRSEFTMPWLTGRN